MIPLPEKVLVTSAWPYINVTPHLGNLVGSVLSADVTARYYRLKGSDVLMVSGSDTHGTPIEVEAIKQGITPKALTDRNHAKVTELFQRWEASFDNYTSTESPIHKQFVQKTLWKFKKTAISLLKTLRCSTANTTNGSCLTASWKANVPIVAVRKPVETNVTSAANFWNPQLWLIPTALSAKASPRENHAALVHRPLKTRRTPNPIHKR